MKSLKLLMAALTVAACSAEISAAGMPADTLEWTGKWISSGHTQSAPNTWLIFRKNFDVKSVPPVLDARIGADTKYWLWINGRQVVFEGGLKRGFSRGTTYYDTVDIAPYLHDGENTVAILVWHFGKNGFSHLDSGSAGLIFDAKAPGIDLASDGTWSCAVYNAYQDTEAPHPNYRLSESNIRFDARKKIDDWMMPSFTGRLPRAAVIASAGEMPFGGLVKRPIPQWKDSGILPYVSVNRTEGSDTIKARLPYNCQITPYFKVKAAEGDTVRIMTDNYRGGSENNVRAEYITADGIQEYESLGWMNGHEVWYIVPDGVEVVALGYRETGFDTDFTGYFECDDEFLNELWRRSARTLYITMRDNYMDCPDRERAQWWGDEVNELGETFYALSPSSHSLALKGIHELVNWQRPDGTLYSPVPAGNWHKELPLQMLASVGWYGFRTQYYFSGDSSFVADVYYPVKRYIDEVWEVDADGFAVPRSGDWNWADWGENSDMEVLTNCWYYLALKGQRDFARQLGLEADVADLTERMKRIEDGFDARYWNGSAYRSAAHKGETDDRAQAMAVVSGLASPERYEAVSETLGREYHASPYMEKYVLEALFMMDKPDQAMKRMHDRYAKMLGYSDYTTLFEGWGIGAEGFGGGTVNHAWSGGPLTLLSQKVCGIAPTSPGFRTFEVNPAMGSLRKAKAGVDTAYGMITVDLERKGRKIKAEITVPEGTTATVPGVGGRTVTLAGGRHKLTITK